MLLFFLKVWCKTMKQCMIDIREPPRWIYCLRKAFSCFNFWFVINRRRRTINNGSCRNLIDDKKQRRNRNVAFALLNRKVKVSQLNIVLLASTDEKHKGRWRCCSVSSTSKLYNYLLAAYKCTGQVNATIMLHHHGIEGIEEEFLRNHCMTFTFFMGAIWSRRNG